MSVSTTTGLYGATCTSSPETFDFVREKMGDIVHLEEQVGVHNRYSFHWHFWVPYVEAPEVRGKNTVSPLFLTLHHDPEPPVPAKKRFSGP